MCRTLVLRGTCMIIASMEGVVLYVPAMFKHLINVTYLFPTTAI